MDALGDDTGADLLDGGDVEAEAVAVAEPTPKKRKAWYRVIKMPAKLRHKLKWGFLHLALSFFFVDLIASFVPAVEEHWKGQLRIAVAVAAFAATLSEYIVDEEEHHG